MPKINVGNAFALDDEQIALLKTGAILTIDNGGKKVSLIIKDGKAHIAKPSANMVKYNRVEMAPQSGPDIFRLTQDESTEAINAWKEGKLPIVVARTNGKGQSRNDFDSCGIKVKVWIQPKSNGFAPMA